MLEWYKVFNSYTTEKSKICRIIDDLENREK